MTDVQTDVPGAAIRRIRGDDYVVVRVSRMFPGPSPTILGLGRRLELRSDAVFQCLLGYQANGPAVRGLYREQIGEPVPGLDAARRELRIAGTTATLNLQFPSGTQTPYIAWGVSPDRDAPVVLPRSRAFRDVMRAATEQRRRELRVLVITPALDALRADLQAIREKAHELETDIDACMGFARVHGPDLWRIALLDGLLGTMLASPKGSVDADDRRDVEDLRRKVATLSSEATRHLVTDPIGFVERAIVLRRALRATDLRRLLEVASFREHAAVLVDNRDIAPSDLWQETYDVVRFAFQTLLGSPQADAVVDAHVLPMIDALASTPFDLTGLSTPHLPAFDAGLRQVPPFPQTESVLVTLVRIAPGLVGNKPGPDALAVGVMKLAGPSLAARVMADRAAAGAMGARLYRALVNAAGLGGDANIGARVDLLLAVDQGDLARLRRVDFSKRFMNGPVWGAAMSLMGIVCLVVAVQDTEAATLRRWSDIIGSGSGALAGLSVVVGRYSSLVQLRVVGGLGGKALGVIGGVAGILSGVLTAREEYQTGDQTGMWLAVGGTAAGAVSVAGFLMAAGLATSATVFGAPAGVVLMIAGAVIGLVTGIVAAIRAQLTTGSQRVFEAVVNDVGKSGGAIQSTGLARPSLRAAFGAVQSGHHSVDFWDVHPDRIPELHDLGFPVGHIAAIVDEEESVVRTKLRQNGRTE